MKVLLHYPNWGNRWAPYIEKELERYDLTVTHAEDGEELGNRACDADVLLSMWANEATYFFSRYFSDKKIITYLRRYECWQPPLMEGINWPSIDAMIFVSNYYRQSFNSMWLNGNGPIKQHVIPNGIDLSEFPLREERGPGHSIAMVCSIKNVKNIPLACQILLQLPKEYKIYHIGLPLNGQIAGQVMSYIQELGLWDRFIMEGNIDRKGVPAWLSDKDCLLSTSINEGNPNNVLEAMSMGIKPVIHAWPGAEEQFGNGLTFDTIDKAIGMIQSPVSFPKTYRKMVKERYSLDNFRRLHDVIEGVI